MKSHVYKSMRVKRLYEANATLVAGRIADIHREVVRRSEVTHAQSRSSRLIILRRTVWL